MVITSSYSWPSLTSKRSTSSCCSFSVSDFGTLAAPVHVSAVVVVGNRLSLPESIPQSQGLDLYTQTRSITGAQIRASVQMFFHSGFESPILAN
ncbi:hypothetical protein V2J09_024108 [Rumex salicifolius]